MPAKVSIDKLIKHSYGWMPDLPDHRDYLFTATRRAVAKSAQFGRSAAGVSAG